MNELFKNTEQQLSLLEELESYKNRALQDVIKARKENNHIAAGISEMESITWIAAISICSKHLDAKKSDTAITEMAYRLIPVADEGCMENDIDAAKRSYVIKGAQLYREHLIGKK